MYLFAMKELRRRVPVFLALMGCMPVSIRESHEGGNFAHPVLGYLESAPSCADSSCHTDAVPSMNGHHKNILCRRDDSGQPLRKHPFHDHYPAPN